MKIKNIKLTQKKGDPSDIIILVAFIFMFAIGFLVYYYFTTMTASALHNSPLNITETQEWIQSIEDLGTYGSGKGFIMIFAALFLSILITSFLVRVHPIFLVIYILTLTGIFMKMNYPQNIIYIKTFALTYNLWE